MAGKEQPSSKISITVIKFRTAEEMERAETQNSYTGPEMPMRTVRNNKTLTTSRRNIVLLIRDPCWFGWVSSAGGTPSSRLSGSQVLGGRFRFLPREPQVNRNPEQDDDNTGN